MSIQKSIKNSLLTANGLVSFADNSPVQFSDMQTQYFSPGTKTFTQTYAKYSSDYVNGMVQGIDPTQPFAWQERLLRMADVVRPSAAILRRADDYKVVLFADRDIDYLMMGSKIVTMGSTWLVTNPFNVSGVAGSGIVQRCNAVWNYLDWYGNVKSEPMVVSNPRADANDSDAQEGNLISKGYFNVSMQYNDVTAQLNTNSRVILGTGAYRVTGYADFHQEFTGDYSTVRILEFTVRYEEPNLEIDDMANHVAGGNTFLWEIQISGSSVIPAGETAQFTATSSRNNEDVTSTEEHPISYLWSSSDENVATVDENGLVTAVAEGEAVITATLEQNPNVSSDFTVSVAEVEDSVEWTSNVPKTLAAYEDCDISAAFFEKGDETDEPLTWTFSGAAQSAYKAIAGGKAATIYCFGYSKTPLVVTASYGDMSVTAQIELQGI